MKIVLDASVAAKWLLVETDSDRAQALFRAWTAKQCELIAPQILPAEVASTLWKRAMRGLMPLAEAARLQREFNHLPIPLHPIAELVDGALDLALRFRHSVYDGLYLALAREIGADLVTADKKLYNTLAGRFPQIILLRDWS